MRNTGSDITIYDVSGEVITVAPFSAGSVHKAELMKADFLTTKFIHEAFYPFGIGCYVMYEGNKYILRGSYEPDRNAEGLFVYEIVMQAQWMRLGDLILFYNKTGINEAEWSLTGNPAAFMQLIVDYAKLITGINYVLGTVTPTTSITVSFSSTNILDALTQVARACSEAESYTSQAEWWFDGLTLNLTRCEVGTRVDFVEGNAVQRMEPQKSDSDEEFTRLYAFGSTRNIPTTYRAGSQDPLYAIVSKRLRLPEGTPYIDSKEGLMDAEIVESVKLFDDVYPKMIFTVLEVATNDLQETVDGVQIQYQQFHIRQNQVAWNDSYKLYGLNPSITFQTGRLAGRTFDVNSSDTLTDSNAITLWNANALDVWKANILAWEDVHSVDKPQTFEAWLTARHALLAANATVYRNNVKSWSGTDEQFVYELFQYWSSIAREAWGDNDPLATIFNYTTGSGEYDFYARSAFACWKSLFQYCNAYDWNHSINWPFIKSENDYDDMCSQAETVFNLAASAFDIVKQDLNSSIYLPNATLCPQVGDEFILFNFNISLVSDQYIPVAEAELQAAAEEYLAYKLTNKKNYLCPTNAPYCAQNAIDLQIGRKVRLYGAVFDTYRDSRVYSFEKALDTQGKATYLIGDSSNYSKIKDLEQKVKELAVSSFNTKTTTTNNVSATQNSNLVLVDIYGNPTETKAEYLSRVPPSLRSVGLCVQIKYTRQRVYIDGEMDRYPILDGIYALGIKELPISGVTFSDIYKEYVAYTFYNGVGDACFIPLDEAKRIELDLIDREPSGSKNKYDSVTVEAYGEVFQRFVKR